ncbi:MAG: serine/threonine-protein kinase, partial [Myxococcota bacterium]|nr:serine/threonine-protein kinase [Myxococcota bacterium]
MAVGDDDTIAGTMAGTGVSRATDSPDPTTEIVAGRYRIVRWLGSGGMGRVYEALDIELGERVAIKMLRGGLSDDALERFRREVRLTRRVQHPNVARMIDIGEHAGDRFLTMELIDGAALTGEVGRRMAWARLKRLAVQICDGLAAAHRSGVIHRDLKPDNVLVERGTDRAVITDFGIARSVDDVGVTQIGMVIGTPRYMAPEQLAGSPNIDARADVFSLGVMLYELASGSRPWEADTAIAIAVAQATRPPQPLVAPHVPAGFNDLVMACLAIDPAERPTGAEAIGASIDATITAFDDSAARRPSRPTLTPVPGTISAPAIETTSIAVLHFACAPDDAFLAAGVQEDLIDTLSTGKLRVRPASAAASSDGDPRELGRTLDVDHVVAGSLRRTPQGLRVTARLVGVADGFQIWAQRVDCAEGEVLGVSEQLGRGIADALSTRATPAERPTDPRAVALYLRAREELRRFWGAHAERATELLEEAVTYAPSYPPLLAALAVASTYAWIKQANPRLLPRA